MERSLPHPFGMGLGSPHRAYNISIYTSYVVEFEQQDRIGRNERSAEYILER